jgi:hypothetical protein
VPDLEPSDLDLPERIIIRGSINFSCLLHRKRTPARQFSWYLESIGRKSAAKRDGKQKYLTRFFSDESMGPLEIVQWVKKYDGKKALSWTQVYYWITEVKLGRTDLANLVSLGMAPDESLTIAIANKIERDPHLTSSRTLSERHDHRPTAAGITGLVEAKVDHWEATCPAQMFQRAWRLISVDSLIVGYAPFPDASLLRNPGACDKQGRGESEAGTRAATQSGTASAGPRPKGYMHAADRKCEGCRNYRVATWPWSRYWDLRRSWPPVAVRGCQVSRNSGMTRRMCTSAMARQHRQR